MVLQSGLIRPADEAFATGELLMGNDIVGSTVATAPGWADYPLNWGLVIAAAIALALNIPNIYYLTPHLLKVLTRWRWNLTIEASIQLSRTRDYISLFCMAPFVLIADRYSFFQLELFERIPPDWHVLGVVGLLLAFYIVRSIIFLALEGSAPKHSIFMTARKAERTFFIIIVFLSIIELGVMVLSGVADDTIRSVLLGTAMFIYFAFIIKKAQILGSACSPFSTILYLCALEFVPAGLLVATCVLL